MLPYLLIVKHTPDIAVAKFNGIEGFFGDWVIAIGNDHAIDLLKEPGEVAVTIWAIEQ